MAINKDSNGYTFGFAIAMVVVVGTLLAVAAMSLKPFQDANVRKEKMKNILSAIQVEATLENAESLYNQHVTGGKILDYNGQVLSENKDDAFGVDILKEYKSEADVAKRRYPLYICEANGKNLFVIPLVGKGLWGPIWGYVSLEEDKQSIFGASFDHKSETPGLGAEISTALFMDQFKGKKISEGSNYTSVKVIKPGSEPVNDHNVDGISGGTITSRGVGEMLDRILLVYHNYFASQN